MSYKLRLLIICFIVISGNFTSCSKEDVSDNFDTANLSVNLNSTSQTFANVYVDLKDVQLKVNNSTDDSSCWVSLIAINQGVYNTDDLTEANAFVLVDYLEIRSTPIYEIRLVFGDSNYMNLNNVLYNLDVTTLGSSIATNVTRTELKAGKSYKFNIELDLDASLSFSEAENMMVFNPQIYTAIHQIN